MGQVTDTPGAAPGTEADALGEGVEGGVAGTDAEDLPTTNGVPGNTVSARRLVDPASDERPVPAEELSNALQSACSEVLEGIAADEAKDRHLGYHVEVTARPVLSD